MLDIIGTMWGGTDMCISHKCMSNNGLHDAETVSCKYNHIHK